MHILLIEDDESINFLYKHQLEKAGHVTDAVFTGGEGFEKLAQLKYDLVLLDVMLPDMNGLEILRRLKSNESTRGIPVVMLSNLGQDTVMQEAFQLGAKDYLIKASYEPHEMIEKVQSIMTAQPSATTPTPAPAPQTSPIAQTPQTPSVPTAPQEPQVSTA